MRELFERPPGNLPALDGLRAIAVILVHIFHSALWGGTLATLPQASLPYRLLEGCRMGVDVFFVLSGFLVGRILVRDLVRDGWLHAGRFYVRRAFRIFPAYWLVLTLVLLATANGITGAWPLLFGTSDSSVLRSLAWENYLYVANYLQPTKGVTLMSWAWSLCVEEHFYLLLPPLLWAIFRFARPAARLPVIVVISLLPLAGRFLQHRADPSLRPVDGFYFMSHNRFDELFLGVVVAYLDVVHGPALARACSRWKHALLPAGLALVALAWARGGVLHASGAFPVVWQYSAIAAGTTLLLLNALQVPNVLTRFLSLSAWYPVARVSYGMYLVHPFLIVGLLVAIPWPAGATGFVAFVACSLTMAWAIAAASFVLFEQPLLDVGTSLARGVDARASERRASRDLQRSRTT